VWRAEADWEAPFVHNFAPTAEGDLVAMSEEKADGALRVWDVTGDAPVLRESYVTLPEHSIHNVAVRDRIAYAAWFTDGLLVFDIEDLAEPLGSYDTWHGNELPEVTSDGAVRSNVNGAADAWPGDHVAVADSARGLVLFDFFPAVVEAAHEAETR
jgi:hypothetical protein